MKKSSTLRTSSANEDERRSIDGHSGKSNDRLGSSRGILRSPTMYDKVSLQKKVRWDEQSIGSQDDFVSLDSQRTKSLQILDEEKGKKHESFHHEIYWISSHNYINNKWKIKSIEEINSFDFDQSIRSLLLSDRSTINNKIKTSIQEDDDEIYEFQANRWLSKDKEDGKLEVYLTPKLIHKSAITTDKKKHPIPTNIHTDDQRHKYDDQEKDLQELKRSSPHDLGPMERSPRGLTSHNKDPFTDRQHTKLKQKEETSRMNSSIDKLPLSSSSTQRSKVPRDINDHTDPLISQQELLAKLTGELPVHPRSSVTSLNQRSKSSRDINDRTGPLGSEQELLARLAGESPYHPR
jgi:hypothetical protein